MPEAESPPTRIIRLHDDRPAPSPAEPDADDRRLVEAATAFLLDSLPRRASLDEAAHRLQVSVPDLKAAFRRRGLEARTHVRAERLHALKRALEAGEEARIDQALVRWGFARHSQAAIQDYRRAFGETPDETLHRAAAARGRPPGRRISRPG